MLYMSKNRPGGLKGRKYKTKVVICYANSEDPSGCFICIFKTFVHPIGHMMHKIFYLSPLKQPTCDCWFFCVPVGCNKLANVVSTMCKLAGYKINHSL